MIQSPSGDISMVRYFVDADGKGVLRDCSLSELRYDIPLWFGDMRKHGRVNNSNKLKGTFWLEGSFINNPNSRLLDDMDFNDEEVLVDFSTYDKTIYVQMNHIVTSSIQISEEHKRVARAYVARGESQQQFFPSLNDCYRLLNNTQDENTYIKVNHLLFFNRKKQFSPTLIEPSLVDTLNSTRYHKLYQVVKGELNYNQNGYWFCSPISLPELNKDAQGVS